MAEHMAEHISQPKPHDGSRDAVSINAGNGQGTNLEDSPMMRHLLDALKAGTDIGHYGRLTFVMVARFFLPDDEIVKLLGKQPGMSDAHAKALVLEVKERDYNPPRRDQILKWQSHQNFPICRNPEDPRACNVYDELRFPDRIYENITHYYEQQVEAHEHEPPEPPASTARGKPRRKGGTDNS